MLWALSVLILSSRVEVRRGLARLERHPERVEREAAVRLQAHWGLAQVRAALARLGQSV